MQSHKLHNDHPRVMRKVKSQELLRSEVADSCQSSVDVVVVGGGPAGSSCAIALARLGARVMLIDAQPRGRDKCCGHCLSGGAWNALTELGLKDIVLQVAAGPANTVAWRSGAHGFEMNLPVSGVVVPRMALDAALLVEAQRVGVSVVQPATAKWLRATMVSVRSGAIDSQVRTNLVIAADGLGSGIARARGWNPLAPGRKYGFAGSWSAPQALKNWPHGRIEMRVAHGGYLGVVAESQHHIHVAGLIDRTSQVASPDELLTQVAHSWPLLAQALKEGRPLQWKAAGPLPWKPTRIADACTVLVGDAAGYAEPFSGEGMRWAFESARGFARVWRNHEGWNDVAAEEYAQWHGQHIAQRQAKTLRTGWFLRQPRRAEVACRAANHFPKVARWLVGSMTQ